MANNDPSFYGYERPLSPDHRPGPLDDDDSAAAASDYDEGEKECARNREQAIELYKTEHASAALLNEKSSFFDILAGGVSDHVLQLIKSQLAVSVDEPVCYTYRRGVHDPLLDESAPRVNIAIHYVPGSNVAEINVAENQDIAGDNKIRKPATWRTLTAGDLLLEPEVQPNLKILYTDITFKVLEDHRRNNRQKGNLQALTDATRSLALTKPIAEDAVNIDSRNVHIVNLLTTTKPQVDLECTCIELDYISLLHLIANFRQLIESRGTFNPLSAVEMTSILGTMVEDARRLLVRSPILSRVAKRVVIIKSKNTRYGFDNGTMFHTFTTSKGIAEIIQLGQGYYSALEQKSKEAQKSIRPKFMQMLIFLLSLVNDADLKQLRPALEASYYLKADRANLELTILKVLPSLAVGPKVFLEGVLSAFESNVIILPDSEDQLREEWLRFLDKLAKTDWLLPATSDQLAERKGRWKVKWNKFKDSTVFNNLQFTHEKGAVNFIPPLKLSADDLDCQVAAEFRNGQTYLLLAKDLDHITLAVGGTYILQDPNTRQSYDLLVREIALDTDIHEAAVKLNSICLVVNRYLQNIREKNVDRWRRLKLPRAKPRRRPEFRTAKPSGRLTMNSTTLLMPQPQGARDRDDLAITWKLDGRKITYSHLISIMNFDITAIDETWSKLNDEIEAHRQQGFRGAQQEQEFQALVADLESVRRSCDRATQQRRQLQATGAGRDDEPIIRVHFPNQVHGLQDLPWCAYTQRLVPDEPKPLDTKNHLVISAERYVIAAPPRWEASGVVQLTLERGPTRSRRPVPRATVMPLQSVTEGDRDIEVEKGDSVLIAGAFMIVLKPIKGGFKVLNYMKLTALDWDKRRRRRRSDSDDEDERFHTLPESRLL